MLIQGRRVLANFPFISIESCVRGGERGAKVSGAERIHMSADKIREKLSNGLSS